MAATFDHSNFHDYCDRLAERDAHLKKDLSRYGYPPFWSRTPCFATILQIILEQQVSLASARAAFIKLELFTGVVTPEKVLAMTDADMKACYFSRQKMTYARHLSEAVLSGRLDIGRLRDLSDEEVRAELKTIKGIGDWTADVFLMMSLHRCDCFASGDMALLKSVREVKDLPVVSRQTLAEVTEQWRPYRTIAAYILWHGYLSRRNIAHG